MGGVNIRARMTHTERASTDLEKVNYRFPLSGNTR